MCLHNEIMNIPAVVEKGETASGQLGELAYKMGHRDARHAAAELSLKYERYIEELEELAAELQDSLISGTVDLAGIRKECGL